MLWGMARKTKKLVVRLAAQSPFDFGKVLPIFTIGEPMDEAYCLPYAQFLPSPAGPPRHRRGFLLWIIEPDPVGVVPPLLAQGAVRNNSPEYQPLIALRKQWSSDLDMFITLEGA